MKDLTDFTVTPGMIDAHVHMQHFEWQTYLEKLSMAHLSAMALYNAREGLYRDLLRCAGGSSTFDDYGGISAKRLIDLGFFEGARLVVLPHYHASVGSHGDQSQFLASNPPLSKAYHQTFPTHGVGADFFVGSVREQVKYGADFIKIMATGGFSTLTTPRMISNSMTVKC